LGSGDALRFLGSGEAFCARFLGFGDARAGDAARFLGLGELSRFLVAVVLVVALVVALLAAVFVVFLGETEAAFFVVFFGGVSDSESLELLLFGFVAGMATTRR